MKRAEVPFEGGSIRQDVRVSDWWSWRLRNRGAENPDAPTASDVTAQENYAVLVKDRLSPAFRDLGLRGRAGRYELPLPVPGWAMLGLQKSAYSDKAEIRFTVNLPRSSRLRPGRSRGRRSPTCPRSRARASSTAPVKDRHGLGRFTPTTPVTNGGPCLPGRSRLPSLTTSFAT